MGSLNHLFFSPNTDALTRAPDHLAHTCSAEKRGTKLRHLGALASQILQCFEIIHDVCHRSPYALARTDGGKVGEFFASADRQRQGTLSYPSLLDLHVVRNVLDKLVNGRLVLLVSCKTRTVKQIDDGL